MVKNQVVVGFCSLIIIVVSRWFTGWYGGSVPLISVAILIVAAVSAVVVAAVVIVAVVAVTVPVSTVVVVTVAVIVFTTPIVVPTVAVVVVAVPVVVVAWTTTVITTPVVVVALTSVLVPVPALIAGDVIVLPGVLLPIRFTTFAVSSWLFVSVLSLTNSEIETKRKKDKLIAPHRVTFVLHTDSGKKISK